MKNTWAILAFLFVLVSSASAAIAWADPTPANGTNNGTYPIVLNVSSALPILDCSFNFTSEYPGLVSQIGAVAADNLSCSYTLTYSESSTFSNYTAVAYANLGIDSTDELDFYYYGPGYALHSGTLLSNISASGTGSNGITIEYSNTTLDCAGFTSTGDTTGIDITYIDNTTIENCVFSDWFDAIVLSSGTHVTIRNTTFSNFGDTAVYSQGGDDYAVLDNLHVLNSGPTAYAFLFYSSNNGTIRNTEINDSYVGIYLSTLNDWVIENVSCFNTSDACYYDDTTTNIVINNLSSVSCGYGMYSSGSQTVTNLSVIGAVFGGADVFGAANISNFSIVDSVDVGVYVQNNNGVATITNGTITGSGGYGMYISGIARNNLIYNVFFNNTANIAEYSYDTTRPRTPHPAWPNYFNTTAVTHQNIYGTNAFGGNFWADPTGTGWSETCIDVLPHDGYCDAPFSVPDVGPAPAGSAEFDYLAIAKPQPSFSDYYFGYYDHLQSNASQIDDLVDTYGYNLIGQTVDFTNLTSETITSSSSCYQGFANETSPCGGLDSGTYGIGGNGAWTFGGNATFDGNRSSGDFVVMDTGWALTNITYYKPVNASGMTVQVSIGDDSIGGVTTANFTVPASCWNYNDTWVKLQGFSAASSFPLDYAAGVFCDNGSIVAGHYSITVEMNTTTPYFDELEAFWNITNTSETHNQFNDYETNANYTFSVKNAVSFLDLDFTKYSSYESFDAECGNITARYGELTSYPYKDATGFILISVNQSATGGALQPADFINGIGNCTQNATNKQFGIYTTADTTGVSLDYVRPLPTVVIYNDTLDLVVTSELMYMQNSSTLGRIYAGNETGELSADFKNFSSQFHFSVIKNLRASPDGVGDIHGDSYLASVSGGDFVVFNPTTDAVNYSTLIYDYVPYGKDMWDFNNKLLWRDYDGSSNIDVRIPADFATVIYVDTFSKIMMTSPVQTSLYKNETGISVSMNYTINGTADGSYVIGGNQDARAELWNPDFNFSHLAFVSYEQLPYSQIVNFNPYEVIIIAGGANTPTIVNQSLNVATYPDILYKTYGYVSVWDYNNTNSTGGNITNCSEVNPWETMKLAQAENFTHNYNMNVFMDGIDIGWAGDSTCFEARLKRLADHVRIDDGKKIIFNSYTIYQTVATYGDYVMRESCFSRWSGNVSDPNYTYENMTLMELNADYLTTIGKPVVCTAFGAASDYDKMMFDYMAFAVLYGTDGGNVFRYGQPDFQLQTGVRVPELGTQMEREYTKYLPIDYKRRYSNGVVHVNLLRNETFPNGKYYWFDTADTVTNLSVTTFFQIYTDCTDTSDINMTVQTADKNTSYVITCMDVGGGVPWAGGYVSKDITSAYSQSGHYYLVFTPTNRSKGSGINIWNRANTNGGVHSWYDVSGPALNESSWTSYGRPGTSGDFNTTNWNTFIDINKSSSASVDSNDGKIVEYSTPLPGFNNLNITLSAAESYNITTISLPVVLTYQHVISVAYNGTELGIDGSADCDGNSPIFNYTDISGELFGACREVNGTGYLFRFAAPSMSDREFDILSNQTTPEVGFTNASLPNGSIVVSNVSFYIEVAYNSTLNVTGTVVFNDSTTNNMTCNWTGTDGYCYANITIANYTAGLTYNVTLENTYGNTNTTENRDITYDSTPPVVNLVSPANGIISNSTSWTFVFNETDNVFSTVSCSLVLDGAVNQTNTTTTNNTNTSFIVTGIIDGVHNWTMNCTDGAGNSAQPSERNFTIDTIAPGITIQLPANTTYLTDNISLNYTITEIHLDKCWYSLNGGANVALTNCANTTFIAVEGSNNITVSANDTAGNTNKSTIRWFTSSYVVSNVTFVGGPANGSSVWTGKWTYFEISYVSVSPAASAILNMNGTNYILECNTTAKRCWTTFKFLPTQVGLLAYNATITNTLGAASTSGNMNINVVFLPDASPVYLAGGALAYMAYMYYRNRRG